MKAVGIHILNMPSLFWPIYKLSMKLFPRKIQRRVHLHSNLISLAEFIPLDILPKSMGGIQPDEDAWDYEITQNLLKKNICYDRKKKKNFRFLD